MGAAAVGLDPQWWDSYPAVVSKCNAQCVHVPLTILKLKDEEDTQLLASQILHRICKLGTRKKGIK